MLTKTSEIKEYNDLIFEKEKSPIQFESGNPFMVNQDITIPFNSKKVNKFGFVERHIPDEEKSELHELFNQQIRLIQSRIIRSPRNPQLLTNLGIIFQKKGELEKAITVFNKAIKYNKNFLPALSYLAKTYFLKKEYDQALNIYKKLRQENANNINILLSIASILFRKNQVQNAQKYLFEVLKIEENNIAAYNNLGVIHLLNNKLNQAISFFRKALNIEYRNLVTLNNIGVCYILQKNYRKAIKYFSIAFSINKDSRETVSNLVNSCQELNHYEKAISILEQYLYKHWDDLELRESLAWAYLKSDNYKKSLDQLFRCLKLAEDVYNADVKIASLKNNVGVVYDKLKDFDNAKKYYEESIKSRIVRTPIPYYNLIDLYFSYGYDEKAENLIRECIDLFPKDPFILCDFGRIYFDKLLFKEAIGIYKEAISIKSDLISPYAAMSVIEADVNNDYNKAIEIVKKGLAKNPKSITLLNNLAYCYLMSGKIKEGREVLDSIEGEEILFIYATRGLLVLKEGNIIEGERLYNMAIKKAENNKKLQDLLKQKKNLELAKIQLEKNRISEGRRFLKKALSLRPSWSVFSKQAEGLLKEIDVQKTFELD